MYRLVQYLTMLEPPTSKPSTRSRTGPQLHRHLTPTPRLIDRCRCILTSLIDVHRCERTCWMATATAADPTTTAAACCAPLGAPSLSDDQAEATARVFKALADPTGQDREPAGHQPRAGVRVRVHRAAGAQPADGQPPPQEAR